MAPIFITEYGMFITNYFTHLFNVYLKNTLFSLKFYSTDLLTSYSIMLFDQTKLH